MVLLKHHLKSHSKETTYYHGKIMVALWLEAALESAPYPPSLNCFVNLGKALDFSEPQFLHP